MDEKIEQALKKEIDYRMQEGKKAETIYREVGEIIRKKLEQGEFNIEQAMAAVDYIANFFKQREPIEKKKKEKLKLKIAELLKFYNKDKYESLDEFEEAAEKLLAIELKNGTLSEADSETIRYYLQKFIEVVNDAGYHSKKGKDILKQDGAFILETDNFPQEKKKEEEKEKEEEEEER